MLVGRGYFGRSVASTCNFKVYPHLREKLIQSKRPADFDLPVDIAKKRPDSQPKRDDGSSIRRACIPLKDSNMTPARDGRRLELLQLSEPLRRYARNLTADVNASSFLVHQALNAAFAEADVRPSAGLEFSLRRDIDRNCALAPASEAPASRIAACRAG